MANLLRKPIAKIGKVHDITPENAGWKYVGFGVYHLKLGETVHEHTQDREVILVLVEGKVEISGTGLEKRMIGERLSVFEQKKPHCAYLPNNSEWEATAITDCVLAVCQAPTQGNYPARYLPTDELTLEERGKGANTRYIYAIAMDQHDIADSLLVTEVFTPQGNWSSYPPHRHDESKEDMTYLEETYYHRLNPAQGFGVQRVFTEDGELDETISVHDGDVVLVPKGHHPVGVPYGYDMYYLNVMAGPIRKWKFQNHPDHDWIFQRDSKSK